MTKTKKKASKLRIPQTSKQHIMKGVGKYKTTGIRRKLKGHGGYAEDIGTSIGGWLGKKAGSLFKSITGLGTYAVTKNSLMANPNDPPILSNTKGGTRIQHREYITDITGSTNFTLTPYAINPGVSTTFPWLAGCALNFEEYILHGLVFEFKSTSATALNSTNTALGTVIMATTYNVVNPNFTAKRDMENYVYSTSCSPDVSALHPVECARDINVLSELFVRNTTPTSGADLRFSDIGKFQIATVGMQAAANIGELWVTYDIELIKPKLPSAYTSIGPSHYVYDSATGVPNAGVAPTASNLFGTLGSKVVLFGTGNTAVTLDTNTITFLAPGRYLFSLFFVGAAAAVQSGSATTSSTVTANNFFINGGAPTAKITSPNDGITSTLLEVTWVVDVSQALSTVPAIFTFTGLTIPATITQFQFLMIPLPVGFTNRELSPMEMIQNQLNSLSRQLADIRSVSCDSDFDEKEPGSVDHSNCVEGVPHDMTGSQILRTVGKDWSILSKALTSLATPPPVARSAGGLP